MRLRISVILSVGWWEVCFVCHAPGRFGAEYELDLTAAHYDGERCEHDP